MSANIKQAKLATWSGGHAMPGSGVGSQRAVPYGMQMGDPGIFGTLWGGIKGAVGGLITGGPLGMVGGAVRGALDQGKTVTTASPQLPPMMTMPQQIQATNGFQSYPQVPKPGTRGAIERYLPGGQTGMIDDPAYRAGKASMTGYHWNKSGYFLKSGEWVAPGTRQVKNRRRNPLNPRALDRSISRITSAKRASKKLSRVTIRKSSSCR